MECLALFGVGGAHPGGLRLTKAMLDGEITGKGMKVLDAGCGTGQTAAYLAQSEPCHVTALDSSPLMVEKAKARFSSLGLRVDSVVGDVENLPFRDHCFDVVLSESVITFTDTLSSIRELKRVLNPEGKLFCIEMVREEALAEEEKEELAAFYGVQSLMTDEEWRQAFKVAGFNDVEIISPSVEDAVPLLEDAADFRPSVYIEDDAYAVLEKHWELTAVYKDRLRYRVFKCRL